MRQAPRPRSLFRRMERRLVGFAMGFIAFFVEKAVLRAIRKGTVEPKPVATTPIRAVGAEAEPVEPIS